MEPAAFPFSIIGFMITISIDPIIFSFGHLMLRWYSLIVITGVFQNIAKSVWITKKKSVQQDWPLVVYTWIIGLAILGYVFGRIAFNALPHPVHWASGLARGVLGVGVGWLWYRWRGDII